MKSRRLNGGVLICVCAVMLFFASGCEDADKNADAQVGEWELVFSDDFERNKLGDDWIVLEGYWKVESGYLKGNGAIMTKKGFPGLQRIEFDAVTDVQPWWEGGPVTISDLSCFIQAKTQRSKMRWEDVGYFFQFGGFNNTVNRIRRYGSIIVEDESPEILIVPDKKHRIVVENDQGLLRFYVDGDLLFEYEEESLELKEGYDRVGLYMYTDAKVDNVKIYTKSYIPN